MKELIKALVADICVLALILAIIITYAIATDAILRMAGAPP